MNLFSRLNPLVYSIFVFLFPVKNRMSLILYAFLLGLSLDVVFNTGGINALATTFIAFIREPLWDNLDLIRKDKNSFKTRKDHRLTFFLSIFFLILLHHFIIFFVEKFNFNRIHILLFKVLIDGLLTFVIVLLLYGVFRIKINR